MQIVIRGAGDLASGVALRLYRAGFQVVMCELAAPLAVRRLVSFSEAVYQGTCTVEGITGQRVAGPERLAEIHEVLARRAIPVVVDPEGRLLQNPAVQVVVDARMTKAFQPLPSLGNPVALLIGLGPGFEVGRNCDAVIETRRSHTLGRVLWTGQAQADTGEPDPVLDQSRSRVLRAPVGGELGAGLLLGMVVKSGTVICRVDGLPVLAPFDGALRGLLPDGSRVTRDMKIGDLDPRSDPDLCRLVSDKSLAIGGGVLEAILTNPDLRRTLLSS